MPKASKNKKAQSKKSNKGGAKKTAKAAPAKKSGAKGKKNVERKLTADEKKYGVFLGTCGGIKHEAANGKETWVSVEVFSSPKGGEPKVQLQRYNADESPTTLGRLDFAEMIALIGPYQRFAKNRKAFIAAGESLEELEGFSNDEAVDNGWFTDGDGVKALVKNADFKALVKSIESLVDSAESDEEEEEEEEEPKKGKKSKKAPAKKGKKSKKDEEEEEEEEDDSEGDDEEEDDSEGDDEEEEEEDDEEENVDDDEEEEEEEEPKKKGKGKKPAKKAVKKGKKK